MGYPPNRPSVTPKGSLADIRPGLCHAHMDPDVYLGPAAWMPLTISVEIGEEFCVPFDSKATWSRCQLVLTYCGCLIGHPYGMVPRIGIEIPRKQGLDQISSGGRHGVCTAWETTCARG